MVPGRSCVGRQGYDIRQVDSGIVFRFIHTQVEVKNLRKQHDSVQIEVVILLEQVCQHGGARCAVAFTEEIFRRVPAPVFAEIGDDEFRKRVRVLIYPVELFFFVLPGDATEPGAGSVHKHQIAGVQQAEIVVHHLIRCGRRMRVIRGNHPPGPKSAHVQPDARRAGPAVEEKGDRPFLRLRVLLRVGHVEHRRFCCRILGLLVILRVVFVLLGLLFFRLRRVIPAFGMDDNRPCHGLIIDAAAFDRHAT